MALPLSNAAADDEEEDVAYAGYAQLPADYLSDSFESSHYSTIPGLDIQAATHNGVITGLNGGHVALIHAMEDESATESTVNGSFHQNGPHGTHSEGMQSGSAGSTGNVVHIDGMEIHVYGSLAGLHLSSHAHNNMDNRDDEGDIDDVDERERQRTEDAAVQRAKEAEDARRLGPLPPDRCQAIKKAMQSISLGGFKPEWAGKVPEEQWINRLRRESMSKSTEN